MITLKALKYSIGIWSFMGIIGIPLLVYFNLLNGWKWEYASSSAIYDQMMVSIYFALGICLARAVRIPEKHRSLIEFTILSSYFHGAVMLFHSLMMIEHRGHLCGDVWILFGAVSLHLVFWLDKRQNPERWSN